jgi:hypothetical protein
MRYGEGNPLYSPEILKKIEALYLDEDFMYLTKRGIGRKVGISNKTFYEWLKTKEEFKLAIDNILSDVEDEFQQVVTKRSVSGEKMSAAWLIYRTANVFGWRNTVEVNNTAKVTQLEELNTEVNNKLATVIPLDGK